VITEASILIVGQQWLDSSNLFHLLQEKGILWNNIKQFVSMETKTMEALQVLKLKQVHLKDQPLTIQMQQGKT